MLSTQSYFLVYCHGKKNCKAFTTDTTGWYTSLWEIHTYPANSYIARSTSLKRVLWSWRALVIQEDSLRCAALRWATLHYTTLHCSAVNMTDAKRRSACSALLCDVRCSELQLQIIEEIRGKTNTRPMSAQSEHSISTLKTHRPQTTTTRAHYHTCIRFTHHMKTVKGKQWERKEKHLPLLSADS